VVVVICGAFQNNDLLACLLSLSCCRSAGCKSQIGRDAVMEGISGLIWSCEGI